MKILKLAICFLNDDDSIASKRVLESKWSVSEEKFAKEKLNILIEDEIAEVIFDNIKYHLTPDIIKEMIQEIRKDEE
jgi:hypothetical protein